mgnify:CR=1 FL=1
MSSIRFEWDENKNRINKNKHNISFEEVRSVFSDENAVLFDDPDHSTDEERFLIIGYSRSNIICLVSHCYRENEEVIRIISARKATKNERRYYEDNLY